MKPDVQITFRHLEPTPELVLQLQDEVRRLYRVCGEIADLTVTIDRPNNRHHKGNHYRVRIALAVLGQQLVASRDPEAAASHVDPHVAVTDAFRSAQHLVISRIGRRRSHRAHRHQRLQEGAL